jgi:hypothetical protein
MSDQAPRYIGFWADEHAKVRLIHVDSDTRIHLVRRETNVRAYCRHLESVFRNSQVKWQTTDDPGNTASYLVDLDTNEYLMWAAGLDQAGRSQGGRS